MSRSVDEELRFVPLLVETLPVRLMKAIEKWRLRRPCWFDDTVISIPPGEGEGWSEIVDALLDQIEITLIAHPRSSIQIGQVKEKTGSLRFYFRLTDGAHLRGEISDFIEQARLRSAHTCMICGVVGDRSGAPGCMLSLGEERCPHRDAPA